MVVYIGDMGIDASNPNQVTIYKVSPRTGQLNRMTFPLGFDLFMNSYQAWKNNKEVMIQEAFPTLSNDEREFILTGYTPEDWAAMFPPELSETNETFH